MRLRQTLALVLLAAGLGVAARYVVNSSTSKETKPAAVNQSLQIPAGKDSFGQAWETNEFTWKFPVENRSQEAVTVAHVSGSCNCIKIEPQAFTVPAGGTQEITVTIDFTKKPSKDGKAAFGLTYMVKGDNGQMKTGGQWVVTGRVEPLLTFSAPLNLGRHSVLAQPIKPLTVTVTSKVPLYKLDIKSSNNAIIPSVKRTENENVYMIVFEIQDKLPIGEYKSSCRITTKHINKKIKDTNISIPFYLTITEDTFLYPPHVLHGIVKKDTIIPIFLKYESLSKTDIYLIDILLIGNINLIHYDDNGIYIEHKCAQLGENTDYVILKTLNGGELQYSTAFIEYLTTE